MTQLPDQSQFGDYGEWPGRDVLDSGGERLGDVREIYLDRETGRPEWVLVQMEQEESRFVPLADANVESRTIRVAHPATVVRSAPAIGAEPRIDQNQERELYAHYHIGYSSEESGSGLPDDSVPPPEPPREQEPRADEPAPFRAESAPPPVPPTPGLETPGVPPTGEPATFGIESPGSYSAPPSSDTPDESVETPPVDPPSAFYTPPAADTPAVTAPSGPFTPPAQEPVVEAPPSQPAGVFPPSAESSGPLANPAARIAAVAAALVLVMLILRRRR